MIFKLYKEFLKDTIMYYATATEVIINVGVTLLN